ncbi:MAG: hypothetical protein IPJ65_29790 [Archangiaceae bacterium]|nr:hypothetical protein [Archangiaceae bacterium]
MTCHTPPANTCLTSTTLRSFSTAGSCAGGSCTYAPSDSTCPFGCVNGACANDPCAGVSCNSAPARSCVGNASRTWAASGTCAGGACSYTYTDVPCANGCSGGTCNAPTCAGVSCNTPPAPSCTSANNLHTYYPAGTCNGSACSYASYDVTCSQGCLNGACIAGSWTLELGTLGALNSPAFITDAAGQPVIAGCDTGGTVWLRRLTDQGWKQESVDTGMGSGCTARVALDSNDEPMVAYYDSVNQDLRFALRNGGSWAPKELISNQGNVGLALALGRDETGATVATYSYLDASWANRATRIATRAPSGAWAETTIRPSQSYGTVQRVAGGKLHVLLIAAEQSALATRTAGTWSFTPLTGDLAVDPSSLEVLPSGDFSLLLQYQNPLRGGSDWTWRRVSGGTFVEEGVPPGAPLATRLTGPKAVLFKHGTSSPYTWVIRTLTNGRFTDTVPSVPLASSLLGPLWYGGTAGRHVLLDSRGYRLSSPPACAPVCSGRTCGDDGCGGSCGTCAGGSSCVPQGTCAPFKLQTLPGSNPYSVALSGKGTLQLVEASLDPYFPKRLRTLTAGTWSAPAEVTGTGSSDFVGFFTESDDTPVVVTTATGSSLGRTGWRKTGSTWTPVAAGTTSRAWLTADAADVWHNIECGVSTITYRSGLRGAWSGAPTTVYTRPSGLNDFACQALALNGAGKVFVLMSISAWASGSNPGARYGQQVLSNETGAWVATWFGPQGAMYAPTGRLLVDGAGALHYWGTNGYWVRPAGGAFAMETGPTASSYTVVSQMVVDRSGAMNVAFVKDASTHELTLARRTGAGAWSAETLPLLNATPSYLGLVFDAANAPVMVVDEMDAFRLVTRAP